MSIDKVRKHFEKEAFDYDDLVPRLIPFYYEQNALIIDLIPFERTAKIKALDLGAGTGVLSNIILKTFSNATVDVFDIADNMIAVCKDNLSSYLDRVTFLRGDFARDDIGSGYDLIVSGLAFHHLNEMGKQMLYKSLFKAMNPGGVFLNRDIVTGATAGLTRYYENIWRQFIKRNGEDDEYWFSKYLEEDIPSSVENQLKWLTESGFEDVGCHWHYLNFAIFGGRKPCFGI